MSANPQWVPLQVHSQYSILDASAAPKALAKRAAECGMPALALTDHGNLFAVVEFYKACKAEGIKPILGCEVYVAPESRLHKKRTPGKRNGYSMVLLAKNDEGYHNLCKLSSHGYLEGFYYTPRIDWELLREYSKGLICLTGYLGTSLGDAILEQSEEQQREHLQEHVDLFGDDLYLTVQRHHMSDDELQADGMYDESWLIRGYQDFISKQERLTEAVVKCARSEGIPLVASNDTHYMHRDDWRAHEVLLNVQSGEPCEIWERDAQGNPKNRVPNPKRKVYASHAYDFKSPEEMALRFQDLPEALRNTLKVAEKCQVEIDFDTKHYPVYLPPSLKGKEWTRDVQQAEVETYLRGLCEEGISKRYTPERLAKVGEIYPDQEPMDVIRARLDTEMDIIAPKGMCDYLLIVWDFINWAKGQGIPVGPGRGSGAGSIVLYLIGITDIEPLRFNLFFERFINPERLSYPDIDVDICMDRRAEVIDYTLRTYGTDNVAQIVTFGTMKAKMAIKDVGRVLSVPLAKVNAIAKLVPEELNITIEKALEMDPELNALYGSDEEARRIIDLAKRLEGSVRNTGIHAAGVIICGDPLTDHIPVFRPKDAELIATQFSMKPVEAVGMLKVDFLGLKTLTCIQTCVEAIRKRTGEVIDWVNLDLEDAKTFDLLNQGKTLGVFQLESGGMQDLARRLRLDRFEEIIAVSALYRPGPMDMIPSFIDRKHGREPIEYDHPWMKEILDETYGIMVYQEQVMQIAQKLANFSLGEGDVLRRAMGKKDHDEMERQRAKFVEGCKANKIPRDRAMPIFDKMEKFASYGFNKSHAAAYGYIAYITAFLKANYPGEWMAALMTCDRDDITKVAKFIGESQSMNIPILPPDVNEAGETFVATEKGIRFAMSGIKGVGQGVVENIIAERERRGPFGNFYDFFKRVDTKRVGKKVIELMVQAGCFDFTGWTRDEMLFSIEPMFSAASKGQKDAARGVMSLFSLMGDEEDKHLQMRPKVEPSASPIDLLLREKSLLGFFLTGHPLELYKSILLRLSCVPLAEIVNLDHDTVIRVAFVVDTAVTRISQRSQKKFSILTISDGLERFELPIWADLYEQKAHLLTENQLLYAVLHIDRKDGDLRLSCRWLNDLSQADEAMIADSDAAYDRVKLQIQRTALARQRADGQKGKQETAKGQSDVGDQKSNQVNTLGIDLDFDSVGLAEILEIKRVLADYPGSVPVRIGFQVAGTSNPILHLDGQNGAAPNDACLSALEELSGVSAGMVLQSG